MSSRLSTNYSIWANSEKKQPYRFGTQEDDPLAREYRKLVPNGLVIASSLMIGQRECDQFLRFAGFEVLGFGY